MSTLTQERLRQLFHYEPATGWFIRLVRTARRVQVGDVAGSLSNGYLSICIDSKLYYSHRLAWFYVHGKWPPKHTDHINGNKTDNRIDNLRAASPSQNQQNRRRASKASSSGLIGAIWCGQRQRWLAQIKINRQKVHLGSFRTPELAHAAYLRAKATIHPFQTIA